MNRLASKVLGMSSTRKQDDLFPKTLADFGYEFKDGKLRNIRTGRPFEFVVHEGDQAYNQKHYEALGEVVTEEVYKLLESECGLKKAPVPLKSKQKEPETFIFVSEDVGTNEKLMVLIHGSGVVRAGQWARRLIINDSLESGTQIPYIKKAKKAGYAVLVMNTNDNYRIMKKERVFIKGSKTPECHAHYVWEHYVQSTAAKHIALVAHSYGGCVTTSLFQKFKKDFRKRVFAVAMTDSVHFIHSPSEFKELVKISYNWVTSRHPLGTKLETMEGDIKRVSSETRALIGRVPPVENQLPEASDQLSQVTLLCSSCIYQPHSSRSDGLHPLHRSARSSLHLAPLLAAHLPQALEPVGQSNRWHRQENR